MTVLTLAAIGFFGVYYFSKMGCKGDGENGLTGPEGSLCFPGFEALGIGGGDGGGGTIQEVADIEDENDENIAPKLQSNIRKMRDKQQPVNLKSRFGPGANPYATNLAHAFAAGIEDQITIA